MFTRKKIKEKFMITIPEPCSEDWNKMSVVDREHKHCGSCEKLVVDFTSMSNDEIVYFLHHNKEKTCGRFNSTQLQQTYSPLPPTKHASTWWKAAMLLPLSLFSKNVIGQKVDSLLQKEALSVQNDSVVNPPDTVMTSMDSLVNPIANLSDSAVASVDTVLTSDSLQSPRELTTEVEIAELVIPPDIHVYGGFAPVAVIVTGGMIMQPPPNPTLISVGCIYNPTPDPVYPIGVFPDRWTFWKWQQKHKMEYSETMPKNISETNPNDKKSDPIPPPLPKTPWYEAILPPSLRPRKNG